MYKLCKTEQSAKRQRLLEEGLLEAMSTLPYEDISVSDLCERMCISRKAFYRYFSGKEGALRALLEHTLMDYASFLKSDEMSGVINLESFFEFWFWKKNLLDALEGNDLSGMLIQTAMDMAIEEIGFSSRFLTGEEKLLQEQKTRFCVCGIMTMMLTWHREGYRQSPRQMTQIAVHLLTTPMILDLNMFQL